MDVNGGAELIRGFAEFDVAAERLSGKGPSGNSTRNPSAGLGSLIKRFCASAAAGFREPDDANCDARVLVGFTWVWVVRSRNDALNG